MASLPGVTEVPFPRAAVTAFVVHADVPTLIDTGTPGGAERLLRRAGGEVGRVLLTHRHADHAGSAAEVARRTGAEVHAPPADAAFITDGLEQPRPVPATPLGVGLVAYVQVALPWSVEPVAVRPTLTDGARVGPFRVVATPGHTAGHVALLWEERGVLFCGDAAANLTRVGPHPAADDPALARESFRRLAELEFDAACFGHGLTLRRRARAEFA